MRHGLKWYWHRLRAMQPAEMRERFAQKLRQSADARRLPDFASLGVGGAKPASWPVLRPPESAPEAVREALCRETAEILAGRWRLFGHLRVQVDDPPRWFMDYASGREIPTARPGFRLNHRELPRGTDIKVLWETSRWHPLVRLAQASWLFGDATARRKCLAWLEDWQRKNPPFIGWNWTSALEAGIRLVNFAWIDALLTNCEADSRPLDNLRQRVLPSHVWYTWRHRSFGSSANNHLLGEIAGLIVALARWPSLERWAAPVDELRHLWEREVLAQFAPDGGNREQALNYHIFSWELCWHTRAALLASGRSVSDAVEDRLGRAADFLASVQVPEDPWDYGDSDSATVTPLCADESRASEEWFQWVGDAAASPVLRWWLGEPPAPSHAPGCVRVGGDWLVFPNSGQAVCWSENWQARLDLSPLGYLRVAAHGHLDALHFSLWLNGVAVVVDPGTGAYYGDTRLRAWFASWPAHNGPHVPGVEFPQRLGPFLWAAHHAVPSWRVQGEDTLVGELQLPHGVARREVRRLHDGAKLDGWQVDDLFAPSAASEFEGFRVCWQFAPDTRLDAEPGNPHFFRGQRRGARFAVGFDAAWSRVQYLPQTQGSIGFPVSGDLPGLCAPAFRRIAAGPRIVLSSHGSNPSMYRTTFLVDRD